MARHNTIWQVGAYEQHNRFTVSFHSRLFPWSLPCGVVKRVCKHFREFAKHVVRHNPKGQIAHQDGNSLVVFYGGTMSQQCTFSAASHFNRYKTYGHDYPLGSLNQGYYQGPDTTHVSAISTVIDGATINKQSDSVLA